MNWLKRLVAGIMFRRFPRLWLSIRIARHDKHCEPEFWLVPALCDRRRIAVDIGSNMGEYAFYMARHARRVWAFEPNPELWSDIRRLAPRTHIEGVALSDHEGLAEFRYVGSNSGVATIEERNPLGMIEDRQSIQTRMVPVRTLDSYNLDAVSFLKIDVEGHEEKVLRGAVETLRRARPSLLVESEDRHNQGAPRRLFAWLKEQGYDAYAIMEGGLTALDEPPAASGRTLNNFLFLPVERRDLVEDLRRIATQRGRRSPRRSPLVKPS